MSSIPVTNTVKISNSPEANQNYNTRAEAVAGVTGDSLFITVGELIYAYDANGTALTTGDDRKWSPSGRALVNHWAENSVPGTTNLATAINAAAAWSASSGQVVHGVSGQIYRIDSTISLASFARLNLEFSTVHLGMSTSDVTAERVSAGAVGFNLSGEVGSPYTANSGQMIKIGKVTSALSGGQFVDVVVARNCVAPEISLGDVSGTGIMKVVRVDTAPRANIYAYVHDLGYTTAYAGLNAQNSQISGLEVDESRVNGVDSSGVEFVVRAEDLQITGAALTALGGINQTDGAVVANGTRHKGVVMSKNCGEGLDVQCDNSHFTVVDDGSNVSVKVGHGGSFNSIDLTTRNAITNGIVIFGGSAGRGKTEHNQANITCDNVDPSNVATATVTMIKFEDQGNDAAENNVVRLVGKAGANTDYAVTFGDASKNNVVHMMVDGAFGQKAVSFGETADGNVVHVATNGTTDVTIGDGSSGDNFVFFDDPNTFDYGITASSAYPSATQNIPLSTNTKVAFNTESYDHASDYDALTNYRSTPGQLGTHEFSVAVETNANCTLDLKLYKNGVEFMSQSGTNGTTHTWDGTFYQRNVSDYWELFVYQGDGARNITNSSANNYFKIRKLGGR